MSETVTLTEASNILNCTKEDMKEMTEVNQLTKVGAEERYVLFKSEVLFLKRLFKPSHD